jgi:hypothetical protein
VPRTSAQSYARNRSSQRGRNERNRDDSNKWKAEDRARKLEERSFIGWDSEGYSPVEGEPQLTMLFGCSVPGRHVIGEKVSTKEMLDLILSVEADFPDAFHVGFAFEYDVNQILQDLPWRYLNLLKDFGRVRWNGYKIKHIPHKMFTVSKSGIVATVYDVFGYFHSKYTTAIEKYGVGTAAQRVRIAAGKERRGNFTWADIDEVLDYWSVEISLLPALMDCIRDAAYGGGFRITQWYGPGALANYALRHNGVSAYMSKRIPGFAQAAIRAAFAGGRFQAWQCGEYDGDVYTRDKNSAYIQAIAELPRLDNGKWVRGDASKIKSRNDIARFGLYHITFDTNDDSRGGQWRDRGIPEPPYPLFHRDKNGKLTWPGRVDGWYWSPEAKLVAESKHAKFDEAIIYQDDGTYPFGWVEERYQTRVHLQEMGNPAEKAFKWALAAMFGAFARRVGWDKKTRKPPRSHELAWAGYTTSHCRAAIYPVAVYAYRKGGLISVDTDGVTATVPFPEDITPEGYGTGLGEWKQEHFSGMLYWQNGIYWLRDPDNGEWKEAKSRGVPKGVISLSDAQAALADASFKRPYKPAEIVTQRTRYVGYKQGLNNQFGRWRVWSTEPNKIMFGGTGKGAHLPPFCRACQAGNQVLHTITHFPPSVMESTPHKLPWLEAMADDTAIGTIDVENFIIAETEIIDERDERDYL